MEQTHDGANATADRLGRGVITVVPVSSNVDRVYPFQVLLEARETGLERRSKAQAEQIRSVSIERIGKQAGQIPAAVMIFGTVFCMALLMFMTAIAMHRKKPMGRKLALWSSAVLIIVFWPAGIYSWWFMHSEGAKQMYGVEDG